MLDTITKTISAIYAVYYLWGLGGIIILIYNYKEKKDFNVFFLLTILVPMIAWRVLIQIISSRYSIGFVYFFCFFASVFLCNVNNISFLKKKRIYQIACYVLIVLMAFLTIERNFVFSTKTRSFYSNTVSELLNRFEQNRNNYSFAFCGKDYFRVLYSSKIKREIKQLYQNEIMDDFIINYKDIYSKCILVLPQSAYIKNKPLKEVLTPSSFASLNVDSDNSNNKQDLFVLSSNQKCIPISWAHIPSYCSNDLINGDIELLDDVSESYHKFKTNILNYSLFWGPDENRRTPKNAYYHSSSDISSLPIFNSCNDYSIAGNNSARIQFVNGLGYFLFSQRFSNGSYELSLLVQGEKGSYVSVVCDEFKDNKWDVVRLATFIIPDKRLYQITTHFSFEGIAENDFFTVGASVLNGEAYFDNFQLKRF